MSPALRGVFLESAGGYVREEDAREGRDTWLGRPPGIGEALGAR